MGSASPSTASPRRVLHLVLRLSLLLTAARGLRVITEPQYNCSQPGIQCTVLDSNCFDLSWLHPYNWTPSRPYDMEVTPRIGRSENGQKVPVLDITWTVDIDSSIRTLQGAEISVLALGTSMNRCVQFQFGNEFPGQRNGNGSLWRFSYDRFQADPGAEYLVTVQHLPKQQTYNRKEKRIRVPNCSDDYIMQTDTCCDRGYCWNPNISLEVGMDRLIVTFTPQYDFWEYWVQVTFPEGRIASERVTLQQGAPSDRVQVPFSSPVMHKPCRYTISVWHLGCSNDCVRITYTPPCPPTPTTTPTPPEHPGRYYLWIIAATVTLVVFTTIVVMLYCGHECISRHHKDSAEPNLPPVIPEPAKRKVWLVYSADHKLYVDVVIKLSDFLRVAWGLDVILDRLHVQDIGVTGAMAWLSRQKEEMEKEDGTILILCSRGAQEKWKAMQNRQEHRVNLREDIRHQFGDLFTPALTLILPDFQKARPYDRYVVAYFGRLFDLGHVPSPLEICPKFALTENLQLLFFRIQRQESHQPNMELTVVHEENPNYQHLMEAIEQCRKWQEEHLDWFEIECSSEDGVDSISTEGEDDREEAVDCNLTRKVKPLIRCPEISVSMVDPLIKIPYPVMVADPTIVLGPPVSHVEPLLSDTNPTVSFLQPLLQAEESSEAFIMEPLVVGLDMSLPELNRPLLDQDLTIQSNPGFQSMDYVSEAQKRFFYQSFLQGPCATPNVDLIVALPDDRHEPPQPNYQEGDCETPNMDLIVALLDDRHEPPQPNYQEGDCVTPNVDLIVALPDDRYKPPQLSNQEVQCVVPNVNFVKPQTDQLHQQTTDQGYNSWNPNDGDLQAIKEESLRLLLQNGGLLDFQ
ncbi:interleukin-17 receptor A [Pseudophryne corroboree]|uniref:interleukin-17 receptor A n=1 Tax=Pseudophryne corroboree TaxID=495146 RepID=UPI003081A466